MKIITNETKMSNGIKIETTVYRTDYGFQGETVLLKKSTSTVKGRSYDSWWVTLGCYYNPASSSSFKGIFMSAEKALKFYGITVQ